MSEAYLFAGLNLFVYLIKFKG